MWHVDGESLASMTQPVAAGDATARRGDPAADDEESDERPVDPGSEAEERTIEEAGYGHGV
jgi:hypothetical protein